MIGAWIMFYVTDNIPELETAPVQIGMHLMAEFVTAALLIVSGLAIIKNKEWAFKLYLFSMGMLVYTLIQSPGYFLQQGEIALAGMFVVLFVIALAFLYPFFSNNQSS